MELEAYMAGFFDGEGSIYMTRRTHPSTIVAKVTNTAKAPCKLFAKKWGGTVQEIKPRLGSRNKTIYRWYIYGRKAQPFLLAIQPYSIIKASLIALALEYIPLITHLHLPKDAPPVEKRQEIAEKIYQLNR